MISELPARLGIERRPIEHDLDMVTLARNRDHGAVAQDAGDDTFAHRLDVAGEAGRPAALEDLPVRRDRGHPRLAGARVSLGSLALLRHELTEARLVDIETLLTCHLERQVDGEAVGVVEHEGLLTGQHTSPVVAHL